MTRVEAVVVGAGPSGLATAACLRKRGIDAIVLERADRVGPSWRNHYERLHLHTAKRYSALPMMPWPDDAPTYPSREQVVAYLEQYAQQFDIVPRFGTEVRDAHHDGSAWVIPTNGETLYADSLVVATGYNRVRNEPEIPGRAAFRGTVMHSGDFKNGRAFRGRSALVIGAGNSGAEIALDLWESGARTAMSIRHPLHVVPRDVFGIPAQYNAIHFFSRIPATLADRMSLALVRMLYGNLEPYGLHRPAIGPISQVLREKRIPLIDIGTVALIKQRQIVVHPGPREFTARGMRFVDGSEGDFDLVLFATGYRAGIDRILRDALPHIDTHGAPIYFGTEAATRGLYFVGYRNPLIGQIHDISLEAVRVADHIAASARSRGAA